MDMIELIGVRKRMSKNNIHLVTPDNPTLIHDNSRLEIAKLDMVCKNDGGLVTFNMFGLFEVGVFIPKYIVDKFIKEYKEKLNAS